MCKYVLLVVLVVLVALMVVAAVVVQEYGWTGFLILLGALVVFGYVLRKATPRIFMYLLMRPLRRMGAVLRGARLTVHSVTPCDPPPEDEYDPDDQDDAEAIADRDRDDESDEDDPDEEDEEEDRPVGPLDWYLIEFTVAPPGEESSEGRIVHRPSWSPAFVGAVGPRPPLGRINPFRGWPPPDQFTGDVQNTPPEVWAEGGWDDEVNQVFGEQRLRMRVGVARAVRAVTIVYAQFTDLGAVPLPIVDVTPGGEG
jgi:hypothetical protein